MYKNNDIFNYFQYKPRRYSADILFSNGLKVSSNLIKVFKVRITYTKKVLQTSVLSDRTQKLAESRLILPHIYCLEMGTPKRPDFVCRNRSFFGGVGGPKPL